MLFSLGPALYWQAGGRGCYSLLASCSFGMQGRKGCYSPLALLCFGKQGGVRMLFSLQVGPTWFWHTWGGGCYSPLALLGFSMQGG